MHGSARSFRSLATLMAALGLFALSSTAQAKVELPEWLQLDVEYRVQTQYLDPMDLSGTVVRDVHFTEQRLRVDTGLRLPGWGGIVTQLDILDGVLFGDNGDYGQSPAPSSGLAVTSRWPNSAGWEVGPIPDGNPLDPDDYGIVLTDLNPININHVYGEVNLPFGLLRVGRQPASTGPGLSIHDGSRSNRWGVSRYSYSADRFLFATKVSEVYRIIRDGKEYTPDRSMDDGVFLAIAYDIMVEDDIDYGGDNQHQVLGMLQWRAKEPNWGGLDWEEFFVQFAFAARFGDEFGTEVYGTPFTLRFSVGPVHFLGEFMAMFGHTREASEGMQALRETDPSKWVVQNQTILGFGARAILDWDFGPVTATLEFDYASGDADPRDETALTTFNFAHDTNVGLLLFEHVLAFESARSAAVGIESLGQRNSDSFPITELSTEGRFHNGIVLFPQVTYNPFDSFHVRFGAMMAWSAAPVTDTIMTVLSEDGLNIKDDAVNWHGGKPARYYGTELDLQVEWRYRDVFIWTVEGAVLFPGAALEDESGDAVNAFLVQNRFTFTF